VPLVANWPGVIPEGRVCDDLVDFSDFLPTFAELAGTKLLDGMIADGRSFMPQLMGKKGNPREWIFCHYDPKWLGRKTATRFVFDKRWKLYGDGRLFDVSADPLEKNCIAADSGSSEARRARKRLQTVLDSIR
jgi:arylsulfatase A-like enzyme